ncbi:MAG: EAL domain-containing protein [Myxococcota bacterium]
MECPDDRATRRGGAGRRTYRLTLGVRLALALVTMATLSTLAAIVAQDRALAKDLRQAAAQRLERSARVGERVVAEHVRAVGDRYRALARMPQLRATLELGDAATLEFLGQQLARQHGAEALAFHSPAGATLADTGDAALLGLVPTDPPEGLLARPADRTLHAYARVAVESRGQPLGSLVVLEAIDARRIASWSELCGADLSVGFGAPVPTDADDRLVRTILPVGDGALMASSGLEAERAAVEHARVQLLGAGALALGCSILACLALARTLVGPIREVQHAIERIRTGQLTQPLRSRRSDEIGDVARGVDRMAIDLMASRIELDLRIEELDRSEKQLANAQRLARLGSFTIELESGQLAGSREFFTLMGIDPPPERGKADPRMLEDRIHADDRPAVRETFEACIEYGHPARLDHRVVVHDQVHVMHTQVQIARDEAGRMRQLEGTIQDVTERRRAEEQVRFLAHHDSLTGLGNRLQFKERLEIAIAQAGRRSTRIGVLFLDLDHFKRINDTLGPSVGDRLLQRVADRIVASIRPFDAVARGGVGSGEDVSIARLGGDEFTLVLDRIADPKDLAPIARRILDALARPFVLDEQEIVIGASIGIATWPQDGPDVDTLLRNADTAMYHAKSAGRNSYQYYQESMNAAARDRLKLETGLRRAIERGGIEVHYQPRTRIATGRTVGFEALTRWRDAELGAVSPSTFIPIAEQTGMIVPLGRQVLLAACRQAAAWERRPGGFEGRISINVSSTQFKVENVAREVADALASTGVNPLRVELEITESLILHDTERVIETLHAIRAMGVRIALDDFGTGYSSLSYLRRLPIDVLKIDMAFVRGIVRSREDAALTQAIIAMAGALGLEVVAEGVETVEQRALLRDWGCQEMQGFLVSPAVPAPDAERWLDR